MWPRLWRRSMKSSIGPGEFARVAIISDVHGNARAYAEALSFARRRGFDQLIILGDLLTYGCEPASVLELSVEALERDDALLIRGNHDQLYVDLRRDDRAYYRTFPDWLREATDWTADAVWDVDLEAMFPWLERWVSGDVLLAHANPFAYGDWTYLNQQADFAKAARALNNQGHSIGIFGHTHRPKVVEVDRNGASHIVTPPLTTVREVALDLSASKSLAIVIDPGSVGQPRSRDKTSTIVFLSCEAERLQVEFVSVPYDLHAHKRAIIEANLSDTTKAKLLGFFA
jgi:predicted phosphodiesterase